jgi:hypothetical protein
MILFARMKTTSRARYHARRTFENKLRINGIKRGHVCLDCRGAYVPEVMDFDHKPGVDKKFNISNCGSRSWKTIELELSKCDLVCANCHRLRTLERRQAESGDQAYIDNQLRIFEEEELCLSLDGLALEESHLPTNVTSAKEPATVSHSIRPDMNMNPENASFAMGPEASGIAESMATTSRVIVTVPEETGD